MFCMWNRLNALRQTTPLSDAWTLGLLHWGFHVLQAQQFCQTIKRIKTSNGEERVQYEPPYYHPSKRLVLLSSGSGQDGKLRLGDGSAHHQGSKFWTAFVFGANQTHGHTPAMWRWEHSHLLTELIIKINESWNVPVYFMCRESGVTISMRSLVQHTHKLLSAFFS